MPVRLEIVIQDHERWERQSCPECTNRGDALKRLVMTAVELCFCNNRYGNLAVHHDQVVDDKVLAQQLAPVQSHRLIPRNA